MPAGTHEFTCASSALSDQELDQFANPRMTRRLPLQLGSLTSSLLCCLEADLRRLASTGEGGKAYSTLTSSFVFEEMSKSPATCTRSGPSLRVILRSDPPCCWICDWSRCWGLLCPHPQTSSGLTRKTQVRHPRMTLPRLPLPRCQDLKESFWNVAYSHSLLREQ